MIPFVSRAALAAALLSATAALAQAYPSKPLRIVIPFPAGGPTDVVGRFIGQKLSEQLGQPVVIDNKPGGNGTIGPMEVTRAPKDGYTLMFTASTFTTTGMVSKAVTYDVEKDFTPVALVAKGPLAVGITNGLPAKNLAELISYAKAHPGKLSFAVGSIGSAGHLADETNRLVDGQVVEHHRGVDDVERAIGVGQRQPVADVQLEAGGRRHLGRGEGGRGQDLGPAVDGHDRPPA